MANPQITAQLVDGSGNAWTPGAQLPVGATMVQASSGNKTNAIGTAVLAAAAGKTTYVSNMEVTASGATAALVVNVTLSDGTWTRTYAFAYPAGVAVQAQPLIIDFFPPLPGSAVNTAITGTLPASGAGGTNACINLSGFQV